MARRAGRPARRRVGPVAAVVLLIIALAVVAAVNVRFSKPRGATRTKQYLELQSEFGQRLEEFKARGGVTPREAGRGASGRGQTGTPGAPAGR